LSYFEPKLYQSFLQSHLKNWLQVLSGDYCSYDASLKIAILDTGVETLFNLDILRQNHDSKTENHLVECLQLLAATEKTLVFNHISSLLVYYMQAVKKHRGALFGQGSHIQSGASMDEPRETGMQFCLTLLGLVQDSEKDSLAWTTRASLLEIVEKENLFDRRQVDVQMTFINILEHILLSLQEGWKGAIRYSPKCILSRLIQKRRGPIEMYRTCRPMPFNNFSHRL
jgi:hypothetical protein